MSKGMGDEDGCVDSQLFSLNGVLRYRDKSGDNSHYQEQY